MKGKVDSVTTKMEPDKKHFEVSLTIIIKDKLNYDNSEKLLDETSKEYLGKEVDIEHHKEPFPL